MNQKLIEQKGQIYKSKIIIRDFSTPGSTITRLKTIYRTKPKRSNLGIGRNAQPGKYVLQSDDIYN